MDTSDWLKGELTRRQVLKTVGAAGAFAALFPIIEACGGTSSNTSTTAKKKLAFGHPHASGAFYAVVEAGIKAECAKRGYELLQSRANGDLSVQIQEVQTWIAERVTAMTILALDINSMAPLLKQAHDAGIPFVSYAQVVPGSDGYVLFDDAAAGTQVGMAAANWVNTKLGGKAKVAVMGDLTIQNGTPRMLGAKNTLQANAPGVEVVYVGKGLLAPEAQQVTQTLLVQHPDLKIIICHADDGALGAAKAVQASGIDFSNIWIAGYDGSQPAITQAISGTSPLRYVAALQLYNIGQESCAVADDVVIKDGPTNFTAPYTFCDVSNKDACQVLINNFNAVTSS